VRLRIEKIVAAQITNSAPDAETSRWAAQVGEKLQGKLAKFGLIETQQSATLGTFIARFSASSTDIAESTQNVRSVPYQSLIDFFGDKKPMRSISPGDAKEWRRAVGVGRAENTVRKYTTIAKKLFNEAMDFRLIESNPFAKLKTATEENKERMYFVTEAEARLVLDACPALNWRVIFALCRYGGLRCPSELVALKWGDVLWDRERFIVRKNKTKKRIVPLFPELRPLLEAAFDAAEDGTEYVVGEYSSKSNFRSKMARIVEQAGLNPWPKIFQNLRSTRETELAGRLPMHVVCEWIGNSPKVAVKHYLGVTEGDYDQAVGKSAANALQSDAAQSRIARNPK